ncbi:MULTISPECIES: DEAD/DEAH box helicase [unclassified Planococcus (in: firmicutes)]|uniref:DEAD/DEAH box helicase n=1 Tax=unclassified Planococcus (in: firmicutes) TaxID=2662419 RepID=UPI000C3304DB|nr:MULTISPECIES: DEAD/DEAH box helicase family protein [unclassified Planococcus (in: firmicutes)]AUD14297.1 DNA/RNA helicase [Planococcus sp. MB-3u-03]PKG48340.1 DNA/RNA helicase [Planococcus sp. Urea-trap-24]PKG92187.1 DNA/RNA helicase [Planococcus sp. Urea-3u-39]PKH42907.1 DNA/RNA helicase [Planococcus sp. MB-3u-09]
MQAIEAFLRGRIWTKQFIPFPEELIQEAIDRGDAQIVSGVSADGECARCLETSPDYVIPYPCATCGQVCRYCRTCIKMGRISSCTELVLWTAPSIPKAGPRAFGWNGSLTPLQANASKAISDSIQKGADHLLYAVCGAGKTEILFSPIHEALQKGLRICVAAPRTDVILELSPRFRQAFPDAIIHTLYGDSPEQTGYGEIILATTHQLYRFQEAFDLLFVDEADAFPYSLDPSLERAVKKAAKPSAPVIYISATPSKTLQKQVAEHSNIFRRYHGAPLPVPAYRAMWNYERHIRKGKLPLPLKNWIEDKLQKKQPFLLFFPSIQLIDQACPLLQKIDSTIAAVHSKDPQRKEKVMQLREGALSGLATSTILERGITIPRLQVAVVGADHRIFDRAALIQIAGRVGRSAKDPSGEVIFFHNGITRQMDAARQEILFYNKEGKA